MLEVALDFVPFPCLNQYNTLNKYLQKAKRFLTYSTCNWTGKAQVKIEALPFCPQYNYLHVWRNILLLNVHVVPKTKSVTYTQLQF